MESKQVLNVERVQALQKWLRTSNTKLTQVNGQRKYGGPPEVWDGPTPGPNCEVFINHIPRDTYEDMLIPLFSTVGPLWEFRLMMNFSGQNRGFAYAKYGTAGVAKNAIQQLHGHMLEPGMHISVCRSTEKKHLCITNLPATTKPDELLQVLCGLTDGVERLSLKAGPGIEGVSAQVVFSSHHTASMAKRMLVEAFQKQYGLNISIKWMSLIKPRTDDMHPLQKRASPVASSLKLPCNIVNPPHILAAPPRLQYPLSSVPPDFCKAVGGPTASKTDVSVLSVSAAMVLQKMCVATGVGLPQIDFYWSHAGPNGFISLTYKVHIPGLATIFRGRVMVLPGPTAATTLERAQEAAAQQILNSMQLSC
ncbi:dead end protein 1 [Dunckerocampus dactyliophorus]|uniref:dead end protein 1 n=1 Tax=Dunckerocampus dactyliophorus TaxID=161453 RepID=UPI00240724B9|nr:dead end protein 1 [Dunckerocampus dactyliophorus]